MEDYLEQISGLIEEKGYARVVDIAERLSISQASVTNMVKRLDAEGLVNYEKYRGMTLTDRGQEVADYIIRRHELLTRFLQLFGGRQTHSRQTQKFFLTSTLTLFEKDCSVEAKIGKILPKSSTARTSHPVVVSHILLSLNQWVRAVTSILLAVFTELLQRDSVPLE